MTVLNQAHKQWATRPADERFRTLGDLRNAVLRRRQRSTDGMLAMRDVTLRVNGTLTAHGAAGGVASFTHWSAGQLCNKLGVPRDLLAKLSPSIGSDVLNDRLHKAIDEGDVDARQRVLLTSDDDGGRTLRALHGESYGRLWDYDLANTLAEYLPPGWRNPVAYEGGQWGAQLVPSGLYAGDRDMFAFFIDRGDALDNPSFDVDGEQFNRGFFAWNSETGAKSFGYTTFMFDRACGNHYVWGAKEVNTFRTRHAGRGPQRALHTFRRFLETLNTMNDVSGFVAAVRAAKADMAVPITGTTSAAKLETLDLAYKAFKGTFTQSQVTLALDAMLREEKNVTGSRYDWLAGFTAVARGLTNADERSKMETDASNLLLVPVK